MAREYFEGKAKIDGRELAWASTFPKTAGFECTRCGFCCYGKIGLTARDLKSFEEDGMSELVDSVTPPRIGTPYDKIMRNKPNNACMNLTEGSLCSIYPKRPMVCRCFPFMVNAGYNNDMVLDVLLRCPYVDISAEGHRTGQIEKRLLDSIAADYTSNLPHIITNTLDYSYTLVKHVQATVPAAFFPRDRKLALMDKAIDLFALENPNDLAETAKNWSEAVSQSSHVILMSGIVEYGQMPSPGEMLADFSFQAGKGGLSKRRLKETVSDFKNLLIYPSGRGISASYISSGMFGIRFVRREGESMSVKKASFEKLGRLDYSEGAVELLKEYLRLLVRRSSFQYCVARCAGFLTDYARLGVADFELESAILANGAISNLDPLARAVAFRAGKGEVDAEAMRFAISNVDIGLIPSLVNDTISNAIVSAVMRSAGAKRRTATF